MATIRHDCGAGRGPPLRVGPGVRLAAPGPRASSNATRRSCATRSGCWQQVPPGARQCRGRPRRRAAPGRAGREAREHLGDGLNLARDCGALLLADRAVEELRAAGGRSVERARGGPDSLTPAEARVARLAADGVSNKDIAQRLFVTIRTVEMHLGRAYRKLAISSRRELATALEDA